MAPFVEMVSRAEDLYWPSGPPMSPLTGSYFTSWACFDACVGAANETIGTCIIAVGQSTRGPMDDLDSEWQRKGATLSDKTARTEFGLTQDEIVQAIRAGKLHYPPGATQKEKAEKH